MTLNKDKTTIFGIQKSLLQEQIHFDKLINFAIGSIAIAGTLTPLMFPKFMDRESKLLTLLLGAVSAGGLCINIELGKRKNKIFQTFDESQLQAFREECQHEIAYDKTLRTVGAQRRLAREISELPQYEHQRWISMYGLQDLILPSQTLNEIPDENRDALPNNNAWLNNQSNVESVVYSEPQPGFQWIFDIVQNSCKSLDKRSNQHFKVDGGSQSGKSTFVSLLIALIGKLSGDIAINLVDPKYPMTQWMIAPSFIGYEQVNMGVDAAIQELENRKVQCLQAKKANLDLPHFKRYLLIVDEWDNIWGNGAGYGDVIDNKLAKKIKGKVQRLYKESAAYNMSVILLGQSPLATDNGFTRSAFNSATRIVLGNEALKWVQDPGFPFKGFAQQLATELENWISIGKRVALIVPNLGSAPYIEPIPDINLQELFDVPVDENQPDVDDGTDDDDTYDKTSTDTSENRPSIEKVFMAIKEWVEKQETSPTALDVWKAWEKLTGQKLDTETLELLLRKLGLTD